MTIYRFIKEVQINPNSTHLGTTLLEPFQSIQCEAVALLDQPSVKDSLQPREPLLCDVEGCWHSGLREVLSQNDLGERGSAEEDSSLKEEDDATRREEAKCQLGDRLKE